MSFEELDKEIEAIKKELQAERKQLEGNYGLEVHEQSALSNSLYSISEEEDIEDQKILT